MKCNGEIGEGEVTGSREIELLRNPPRLPGGKDVRLSHISSCIYHLY